MAKSTWGSSPAMSLVPHVDEAELFEVTRQGLDFYAGFFDRPYPFGNV